MRGSGEGGGVDRHRAVIIVTIVHQRLNRGRDVEVLRDTTERLPPVPPGSLRDSVRRHALDVGGDAVRPEQQASSRAAHGLDTDAAPSATVVDTDQVGDLDTLGLPTFTGSSVEVEGDLRWDADTFDVFSAAEGRHGRLS